jgi:hypothetical protein
MRMGKFAFTALLAVAALGLASQPAHANAKDRAKRADTPTGCTETCRPVIRSMSETTPARKTDCPKVRRILM